MGWEENKIRDGDGGGDAVLSSHPTSDSFLFRLAACCSLLAVAVAVKVPGKLCSFEAQVHH